MLPGVCAIAVCLSGRVYLLLFLLQAAGVLRKALSVLEASESLVGEDAAALVDIKQLQLEQGLI